MQNVQNDILSKEEKINLLLFICISVSSFIGGLFFFLILLLTSVSLFLWIAFLYFCVGIGSWRYVRIYVNEKRNYPLTNINTTV